MQDIDIALSAMKMTAEREEVIDFVAPYYETTGILIGTMANCIFKYLNWNKEAKLWIFLVSAIFCSDS